MNTTDNQDDIVFHAVKKIEIIVKGEKTEFVKNLLTQAGTTGFTLIRDIAGMGHHGFHEGRLLFNNQASLVMFMAVAPEPTIRKVAAGLRPLFEKSSGVMFITDTHVVRLENFVSS